MSKIIRVAIPTDDGLTVRQNFRGSRAFAVATIKSGRNIRQDLRWNLLSEVLTSGHGFYYNLVDCDVVIVKDIGICPCRYLNALKKKIFLTDEPAITKAITDYLKEESILNEEKQTA